MIALVCLHRSFLFFVVFNWTLSLWFSLRSTSILHTGCGCFKLLKHFLYLFDFLTYQCYIICEIEILDIVGNCVLVHIAYHLGLGRVARVVGYPTNGSDTRTQLWGRVPVKLHFGKIWKRKSECRGQYNTLLEAKTYKRMIF